MNAMEPMADAVFKKAEWIGSSNPVKNHYILFVKNIKLEHAVKEISIRVSASYFYEIFINGEFVNRGPVHGDPAWCGYDELNYQVSGRTDTLCLAVLVHHLSGKNVYCLLPAPGGLIVEVDAGGQTFGTDQTWKALDLRNWKVDVPSRTWMLGYCEDYDANLEPAGWDSKQFPEALIKDWPNAVPVANADDVWKNYHKRITPYLKFSFNAPVSFKAFKASLTGKEKVEEISRCADEEPLEMHHDFVPMDMAVLNKDMASANAFTFDLGQEKIGFYFLELVSLPEVIVEFSGSERLLNGRPVIAPTNDIFSFRYRTKAGLQTVKPFFWSGFRYLHLVFRGNTSGIKIQRIGYIEKKAPIHPVREFQCDEGIVKKIFHLCEYTLQISAQEHLIDCPTREQAQYWGDAVFIAQSLWKGFNEPSYLKWYLECFLNVPFRDNCLFESVYPGNHENGWTLLDYDLIPLIGQRFYYENTGEYYKPKETFDKAIKLNRWFEQHKNKDGLVDFDNEEMLNIKIRNFIDHPGIPWHQFSHPGIDRKGISCPLNVFYLSFIQTLSKIAFAIKHQRAENLAAEAEKLQAAILRTFYEGKVFHDAIDGGVLSSGTSWQTNGLAVYFDLIAGEQANTAMKAMIDGYDSLCRCTPYFHFYFLPAMRKAGLEKEAYELIKREWSPMLEPSSTGTAWETFTGNQTNSLCHPWSTAPYLFLLEKK